ncbi:hypothetical protein [Sandaracinus amylolyticus]|uniref:Uncharacterized protein n=1 Tax=Sandaracinus amylolyticus TaxID=927083 RepID=A0A0F6YIF9_9BACT|nr:hypothetical protein [Sandaracinus amylolyticus]AKF06060.1 hypothetical protein DB32_003209 [Sandaracinus amylolyticus]
MVPSSQSGGASIDERSARPLGATHVRAIAPREVAGCGEVECPRGEDCAGCGVERCNACGAAQCRHAIANGRCPRCGRLHRGAVIARVPLKRVSR